MVDSGGLIKLLEDPTVKLPPIQQPEIVPADLIPIPPTDLDWKNDPVGRKLDKIRTVFLNAKTPTEIGAFARGISEREWLDWTIKLTPKQVEAASVQITTIRVELPPRDKPTGEVIEVELPAR